MKRFYLVLLVSLLMLSVAQPSSSHPSISPSEFMSQRQQDGQLLVINVDALYRGELAGTHVYIPYNRIEDFFIALPKDKARAIVVYALDPSHSDTAATSLASMGYHNLYILTGDYQSWTQAGLEFFDSLANNAASLPTGSIDFESLSSYLGIPRSRFVNATPARSAVKNVANSQLYLVEFSDFNCGYCSKFHRETYPLLEQYYFNTGIVNYVHRDFVSVGGNASQQAAELLECAREQLNHDAYFQALQSIYLSQGRKNAQHIRTILQAYPLDSTALENCFSERRYSQYVSSGREAARQATVRGTPGFVLGYMNDSGVIEGIRITGAVPFQNFQQYIDTFLSVQQ